MQSKYYHARTKCVNIDNRLWERKQLWATGCSFVLILPLRGIECVASIELHKTSRAYYYH